MRNYKPTVLLIRIPEIEYNIKNNDVRSFTVSGLVVPLGVTYLASVIRDKSDYAVKILDLYADHYEEYISRFATDPQYLLELSLRSISCEIEACKPVIIGFSAVFNFQHELAKNLIEGTKIKHPGVKIYLGGYPTVFPEMVIKNIPALDVAFIGEAEKTILEVLVAEKCGQSLKNINGIAAREGGAIFINDRHNFEIELDKIPFPAFDMLPLDKYKKIHGHLELPLMTSRSCPFSCNYCSVDLYSGHMLRLRSTANLIQELEQLHEDFKISSLAIRDDNFVVNKRHAKAFLEAVLDKGLTVPWLESNGFHVNSLNEEFLDLCKATSCSQAIMAVESGSLRVLKEVMNKKVNLDHGRKMAEYCRKIGLPLQCYFVIGNPGETTDEIQQTINYALELQVDHCTFSIATPFPGTKYYDLAIERGYLVNDSEFILGMKYMGATMSTEHFSAEKLKGIQYDANMKVNFFGCKLLREGKPSWEKALDKFSSIANQYKFHAVARLLQGYLYGLLDMPEKRNEVYIQVKVMLCDEGINAAYIKYFSWENPPVNDYRQWLGTH
ncbi:MAG: cobalamin B12-binding domain-containing protein [Gammaproteobacteria bacterium]|nr:cobalamin B12-binding domain-containing protein [Gammaproteobacteria bacterium]